MFVMLISALFTQAIKSEAQYFISYGDSDYPDCSQIKIWKAETDDISKARVIKKLEHKNIINAMVHPTNPNIILSSGWIDTSEAGYGIIRRFGPKVGFAQIKIWKTETGDWSDAEEIQTLNHGLFHNYRLERHGCLASFYMMFHPADPHTLISGSHGNSKIKFWKTETGDWSDLPQDTKLNALHPADKQREEMLDSSEWIGTITPHPSNRNIYARKGRRGTLHIFTSQTGDWTDIQKNIFPDEEISKIIFHPKNPNILLSFSAYYGSIRIWKTDKGDWSDAQIMKTLIFEKRSPDDQCTIKLNPKNSNIFAFILKKSFSIHGITLLKATAKDWSDIQKVKVVKQQNITQAKFHSENPNVLIVRSGRSGEIVTIWKTETGDWSDREEAGYLSGCFGKIQFNQKNANAFFAFSKEITQKAGQPGRFRKVRWNTYGTMVGFKASTSNWYEIQKSYPRKLNHRQPEGVAFLPIPSSIHPKVVDYQKQFEAQDQSRKIEMLATDIGQQVLKRDIVQCGFGPGSKTLRCFKSLLF